MCMRQLSYPYGPYTQIGYINEESSYQAVQILMLLTLNNSVFDQNSQSAIVQYSWSNATYADSYCLCTSSYCNQNFQTCAPNLTNYIRLWTIQQSYTGTILTTVAMTTTSAILTTTVNNGKQTHSEIFLFQFITYILFFHYNHLIESSQRTQF
ncbi:unnamed protein product [Didymodactylos carnosus]|uniref:Uncharacterized protein n=1 Tax=Didymodactylos carnosus TaxID=1234261 RepID=A0A814DMX8_9BILA|nr:unnamed protein product [Didymodactylos carnosus]CAF1004362.1 unnamed protein product [Didymodactylos carnosus]CAF3730228.1 unnamed protein product [Didymodactylos carnosus]CAF3773627.1 unnamed protein product [Didymodactylos carnosus]